MGIVQSLSLIALRQVATGASRAAGLIGIESVARFLGDHFTNHNRRLSDALQGASSRAWQALEITLAGESLWRKLDDADDRAFRQQLRAFLDSSADLPAQDAEFRAASLRELRAARKSGLLLGAVNSGELARQAADLAHLGDAAGLVEREWQALDETADLLREARHTALAKLVALRPGDGQMPLIAVAVRYFFRRAVEQDAELHRGLSFAQWDALAAGQRQGFDQLGQALDAHGRRLDEVLDLLGEVRGAVLDLRQEIAGQREQIRDLAQDVMQVLAQHQLERRELRGGDSLSIRGDDERRLVKELVARYRALPPERRHGLPALLNAVGKMEVVAGNFDAARRDFKELVQILPGDRERAEAHFNAYQAALECRQWPESLIELRQAANLDSERFAPFPLVKFEPERILGAGGFGVAFLCRDRDTKARVVVKVIRADGLDRSVSEVFAEARALEEVQDEGIIRLRHCDYAGASRSRPYIVMDYFEGVTLAEHVAQRGPLGTDEGVVLLARVARALHKAHEKGILHRDVKPANILVASRERERPEQAPVAHAPGSPGQVKLIDFGLALRQQGVQNTLGAASSYTQTLLGSSIAGTLDYAAPEQLGKRPGEKVGPHSDIYGLGKTACFALFGTTLPLARHWRGVSPELADLLGQCLADDPNERPASCAEVADRLAGPLAAPPVAIPGHQPVPRPTPVQERPPGVTVDPRPHLGIGALLGAVMGLVAAFSAGPGSIDSDFAFVIFLTTGVMAGLGATLGRRQPFTIRALIATLPLVIVLFVVGHLLVSPRHPVQIMPQGSRTAHFIWLSLLGGALGFVWGWKLENTLGAALVFGAVAGWGTLAHVPAFLLAGAVLGGVVAAVFAVADPFRNLDRAVDSSCGVLLDSLGRLFPARDVQPARIEQRSQRIETTPSARSTPVSLAMRLILLTLACGAVGLITGMNSGAASMVLTARDRDTMQATLAAGGAAGALVILLVWPAPLRSGFLWLIAGGIVSMGASAGVGGFWWVSPVAAMIGLVVWGTLIGLLAGVRLRRPALGAIVGALLSGALVSAGQGLEHPDTAGIVGLALGLFTGTLLWTELRTRWLVLARGIAGCGLTAAVSLVLLFRPALGQPARAFDAPVPGSLDHQYDGRGGEPAFNASGDRLLTTDGRGVYLWDVAQGKRLNQYTVQGGRYLALGFFEGDPLCLKAEGPSGSAIINVGSGQKLMDGPGLAGDAWHPARAAAAPGRETFLLANFSGNSWNLHLLRPRVSWQGAFQLEGNQELTAVALSPSGPGVLLGYRDGAVRLGNLAEGDPKKCRVVKETRNLTGEVMRVGFSPSGRMGYAITSNRGSPVLVWNVEEWKDFVQLPMGTTAPSSAAFSLDDQQLLVGTDTGSVQRWDVTKGELLRTHKVHGSFFLAQRGFVRSVAFVPPYGNDVISQFDRGGRVLLWRTR